MRRKIKFRGKSIHDKKWVYGNLRILGERAWISDIDSHAQSEVMLDSVGQYASLTDEDRKEIYEGDFVEACFKYESIGANGGVIPDQDCIVHGVVVWEDYGFCIKLTDCEYPLKADFKRGDLEYMPFSAFESPEDNIKVQGNIHDDPEMTNK